MYDLKEEEKIKPHSSPLFWQKAIRNKTEMQRI
jgi:hypothetical protein